MRDERHAVSEQLVAFRLPAALLAAVDREAARLGVSRSRMLREAVRLGLRSLARRKGDAS